MSRKLDIYNVVKIGQKVMKRAKIPLYWSKYLRKAHTIHQHIILMMLREYFGNKENTLQILDSLGMKEHRKMRASHISWGYDTFLLKKGVLCTISRELRMIPEHWSRIVM